MMQIYLIDGKRFKINLQQKQIEVNKLNDEESEFQIRDKIQILELKGTT